MAPSEEFDPKGYFNSKSFLESGAKRYDTLRHFKKRLSKLDESHKHEFREIWRSLINRYSYIKKRYVDAYPHLTNFNRTITLVKENTVAFAKVYFHRINEELKIAHRMDLTSLYCTFQYEIVVKDLFPGILKVLHENDLLNAQFIFHTIFRLLLRLKQEKHDLSPTIKDCLLFQDICGSIRYLFSLQYIKYTSIKFPNQWIRHDYSFILLQLRYVNHIEDIVLSRKHLLFMHAVCSYIVYKFKEQEENIKNDINGIVNLPKVLREEIISYAKRKIPNLDDELRVISECYEYIRKNFMEEQKSNGVK